MTIAEEEKVFIFPVHREGRIVLHDLEIEGSEIIRTAKGASGMAAGSAMHHSYNIPPDLGGYCL
jgi:hypothetical protein